LTWRAVAGHVGALSSVIILATVAVIFGGTAPATASDKTSEGSTVLVDDFFRRPH
jgi:hypothetical protein